MTRSYHAGYVRNHETFVHGIDHVAEALMACLQG